MIQKLKGRKKLPKALHWLLTCYVLHNCVGALSLLVLCMVSVSLTAFLSGLELMLGCRH